MGKYNVGDKFLIEIDQVVKCDNSDPVELFKIKGFNSLVFDKYGLDKLPKAPVPLHSDKEKIHVGDVIKHKNNENVVLVVTQLYDDGDFSGMKITKTDKYGHLFSYYDKRSLASFEKTGQHYDLNKFFLNDGEDGELPYN